MICTTKRFTMKERPMIRADLDDFVACFAALARREQQESERFHLRPCRPRRPRQLSTTPLLSPDEVAAEIAENVETAVRFWKVAATLGRG